MPAVQRRRAPQLALATGLDSIQFPVLQVERQLHLTICACAQVSYHHVCPVDEHGNPGLIENREKTDIASMPGGTGVSGGVV